MATRKKRNLPDLQILIGYEDLQELLYAAGEVETIKAEQEQNRMQMAALRLQFTELMERFREIQD